MQCGVVSDGGRLNPLEELPQAVDKVCGNSCTEYHEWRECDLGESRGMWLLQKNLSVEYVCLPCVCKLGRCLVNEKQS